MEAVAIVGFIVEIISATGTARKIVRRSRILETSMDTFTRVGYGDESTIAFSKLFLGSTARVDRHYYFLLERERWRERCELG